MFVPTPKTFIKLLVTGLLLGSTTSLRAEDASSFGIVRVSDSSASGQALQPIPENSGSYYPTATSHEVAGHGAAVEWHGAVADGYYCPPHAGGRSYHSVGRLLHHGHPPTYSPGHGWSPPVKRPILRGNVEYLRYHPNHWYGDPRRAKSGPVPTYPMVYQPTDTTQLGFYYQQVPYWRPRPGMIPPPPSPEAYHTRGCPPWHEGFGYPPPHGPYWPHGVLPPVQAFPHGGAVESPGNPDGEAGSEGEGSENGGEAAPAPEPADVNNSATYFPHRLKRASY